MVEITTSFSSFSLAPLRCMKKRATSRALMVAMMRATAALKRPRFDVGGLVGEESADKQGGPDGEIGLERRRICVIRHNEPQILL